MKYIIIALVAWILLIFISGLIYFLVSHNFYYPDFWIQAIIKCRGKEEGLNPNKMFSNTAFIDTAGASNIFGAYFGIMIDAMYLKGTASTATDTTYLKSIARAIVSVVCIAPFMITYVLISDFAAIMIIYLFKRTVPFFMAMLFLFSFVKLVHKKLGLLNLSGKEAFSLK